MRRKKIAVTASIGVSAFSESATKLGQFQASADDALYGANKEGRNKVVWA